MLHLTDAPGDASAIFIIAENTFLACFCKSGADVSQLYNGNNVDLVRVYRIARQLSILQPNYHRARDVMQQLMEVQHTEECDHRLDRRCGEWLLKSGAEGVARLIMVIVLCVKCCWLMTATRNAMRKLAEKLAANHE